MAPHHHRTHHQSQFLSGSSLDVGFDEDRSLIWSDVNVSDAGGHDRRSKYGSEPIFGDFLFDLTNKLVGKFDMASSSTLRSLSPQI